MDDKNEKKKKESIDEILSDLNGLLNRMPSILDGIKMPEIKPVEFAPAREEKRPEPAQPPAQPPAEADKTVVLEGFQGLPEGSQAPEPQPKSAPQVPSDASDKTIVIESLSSLPEGAKAPREEKLVPQSLGDFMFGGDASGMEQPAEEPGPEPQEPKPAEAPKPAEEDVRVSFETTKDFGGIPDIDALMQLSESDLDGLSAEEQAGEAAPAPGPAAKEEPAPVSLPEISPAEPAAVEEPSAAPGASAEAPAAAPEQPEAQPSEDELAEFEKQLAAAAPQGGEMENKPEEEKPQPEQPEERPAQEAGAPAGFEALTIEPEGAASQPEPSLNAEPSPAEAQPAQPEPSLSLEPKPEEAAPEPQLEPSLSVEPSPAEAQPAQPEPGLVLEPASAAVTPPAEPSGEETLVVPPPAGAASDEEKTVIFEAGSTPGVTSRSQAGDLAGLAEKPAPEGIPPERQRSLAFLYAVEDKALCASLLAELDAICLKSADKPMFIRRASVRECEADVNANYVLQSVNDAGANGLICVGAIPQEKVYEIESVFNSAGGFFRHYDSSNFGHSAALDLVMDLILR